MDQIGFMDCMMPYIERYNFKLEVMSSTNLNATGWRVSIWFIDKRLRLEAGLQDMCSHDRVDRLH